MSNSQATGIVEKYRVKNGWPAPPTEGEDKAYLEAMFNAECAVCETLYKSPMIDPSKACDYASKAFDAYKALVGIGGKPSDDMKAKLLELQDIQLGSGITKVFPEERSPKKKTTQRKRRAR